MPLTILLLHPNPFTTAPTTTTKTQAPIHLSQISQIDKPYTHMHFTPLHNLTTEIWWHSYPLFTKKNSQERLLFSLPRNRFYTNDWGGYIKQPTNRVCRLSSLQKCSLHCRWCKETRLRLCDRWTHWPSELLLHQKKKKNSPRERSHKSVRLPWTLTQLHHCLTKSGVVSWFKSYQSQSWQER